MSASPLSPADLSTALQVYRETGTYAAAARALGRDESTVRKALRRHAAPDRAELFAAELETSQRNYLSACRKARRKVVAALDTTDDPRDIAMLAHVLHEGLRAVSTARSAHARLTTHDPASAAAPTGVVLSSLTDEELEAELLRLSAEVLGERFTKPDCAELARMVDAVRDKHHTALVASAPEGSSVVILPRILATPRMEHP